MVGRAMFRMESPLISCQGIDPPPHYAPSDTSITAYLAGTVASVAASESTTVFMQ